MNDRVLHFFTSDWHIGHKNVLEFDKRPFRDLDHMHQVLINNFNSTVPVGSVTYFFCDMGLCSGDILKSVMTQLNGTKVLVRGNHDGTHNKMFSLGFDVVLNRAAIVVAGKMVTMSHCPITGIYREDTKSFEKYSGENWHGESKNWQFTVPNEDQFHLHGHIHSPNGGKSQKILERQFDVGVVANAYRPVSIAQIESWVSKYGR